MRPSFLLGLCLLSSTLLAGCSGDEAAPVAPWLQRFARGGQASLRSLAVSPSSSDIAFTGTFSHSFDFGQDVLKSAGGDDLFVANTSAAGEPLWAGRTGSDGNQGGSGVAFTQNGELVLAGRFYERIRFGGYVLDASDLAGFVARFDATGRPLRADKLGDDNGRIGVNGLALDPLGAAIVGGVCVDEISIGNEIITCSFGSSFVAKLSPEGKPIFATVYGGSGHEISAVATDYLGATVVAGQSRGTISSKNVSFTSSNSNVFVSRLDPTGKPLWLSFFDGNDYADARGVAVGPDGDIVVVGQFVGSLVLGNLNAQSIGTADAFVARLSADGKARWLRRFGNEETSANAVAVGPDGHVFVTGAYTRYLDFGGGGLPSDTIAKKLFLVELDRDGGHVSSRAVADTGLNGDSEGTAIALDPSGDLLVAGSFQGELSLDGMQVSTEEMWLKDIFVARLKR